MALAASNTSMFLLVAKVPQLVHVVSTQMYSVVFLDYQMMQQICFKHLKGLRHKGKEEIAPYSVSQRIRNITSETIEIQFVRPIFKRCEA